MKIDVFFCGGARRFVFAVTVAASAVVAARTGDATACGMRPEWGHCSQVPVST